MPEPSKPQGKVAKAFEDLRILAQSHAPAEKLPTFNQLCETLQISRATLDAALGHAEQAGHIVRRHGAGIFVPELKKHSLVSVILGLDPTDSSISPFYRLLLQSITAQTQSRGLRAEVHAGFSQHWTLSPARQALFKHLIRDELYGVIHITGQQAEQTLLKTPVPSVFLNSWPGPGWRVGTDTPAILRLGLKALDGCQCGQIIIIGHWPGHNSSDNQPPTLSPSHPKVTSIISPRSWFPSASFAGPEMAHKVGQRLAESLKLDLKQKRSGSTPIGLLITDDTLAQGILIALLQAGIRPSENIVVAAHANTGSPILMGFEDTITQLQTNPADYAHFLLDALAQQQTSDSRPIHQFVKPTLVLPRAS